MLLITGHYGAIEYIPTLLALNNIRVSIIAKFKTLKLKKRVFEQAARYGIHLIDGENRGEVLKSAINELRNNRVLITQCDEMDEWRPSVKEKTSFLGNNTGLDRTINILHKRTEAEVLFGVIYRFNLDQYRFLLYSHSQMIKMVPRTSSAATGEIVLKVLEQFICSYPEQWYQWKKLPDLFKAHNKTNRGEMVLKSPYFNSIFNVIL